MTRPASWRPRLVPLPAPGTHDPGRLLAGGSAADNTFLHWPEGREKAAWIDWTAWGFFALALAGAGVAAKLAGVV